MKLQPVQSFARAYGVSVRTLHYYDEIGLLPPAQVTEAGYRLYGQQEAKRLQQILFFRELEFPLREIRDILTRPDFDETFVLRRQRELLCLKRQRLDRLIGLVDTTLKGELVMNTQAFDKEELRQAAERFAAEAKERWGQTPAWKESNEKMSGGDASWLAGSEDMNRIFSALAERRTQNVDSPEVQALVGEWQAFITEHFYTCSDEILSQLGEMYVADERFTAFYDDRYGTGTAEFIRNAIQIFCKKA